MTGEVREAILRYFAELAAKVEPAPFPRCLVTLDKFGLTPDQQRELRRRLACRL